MARLAGVLGDELGSDHMERTFKVGAPLPIGEPALKAAGWHKSAACVPGMGFQWTEDERGPVQKQPLALYTTKGGAMSGLSVQITGEPAAVPLKKNFFTKVGEKNDKGYKTFTQEVSTREGDPCTSDDASGDLGNQVVVAPNGAAKQISLEEADVEAESRRGSCFDGMGWHRFYDLTTMSSQDVSWDRDNMMPVVPMYHDGKLNAIFFLTFNIQQGFFGANEWEPIPLPRPAFCLNACHENGCTKKSGTASTFHVYFNDPKTVVCDKSLKCVMDGLSCCPVSDVVV
jgi:hypothetical protein